MKEIITELTGYLETIQNFDKEMSQDAGTLYVYIIELTQFMSRANFLMAEYSKKFREAKASAYVKLAKSKHSEQRYYAPSLAKDYIDSQCSEEGYIYDLAERLSRTCVHTIEGLRTIVSSLKSERAFSSYGT